MKKIAAFGEIMQRFTPPLHQRLIQASHFDVLYTGTGLNVLGALSQYGNKTKMLTTLPSNALGLAAAKTIKENSQSCIKPACSIRLHNHKHKTANNNKPTQRVLERLI